MVEKKKTTRKSKSVKKSNPNFLNLMTTNEEGKLEIVEVPIELRWEYFHQFGTRVLSTTELQNWISNNHVL